MPGKKESHRLILDRDLPAQDSRFGIGDNPVDVDEASQFTLEAELVRLSGLVKEGDRSRTDQVATSNEIKMRMKQAQKDRDKLSKRGKTAFEYLRSTEDKWGIGLR